MTLAAPAFPYSHTHGPWEAWRLGWMISEMWMTSTYDAMTRTSWPSARASVASPSGKAALREWQRMWSEKLMASVEAGMQMQRAGYDLMLGGLGLWQSGRRLLAPAPGRNASIPHRPARLVAGA